VADDALDFADRNRIDAGKRLVEQDQPRLGGQGTGDFHSPPFAARQAGAHLVGDVRNLQFIEQIGQLAFAAGSIEILA